MCGAEEAGILAACVDHIQRSRSRRRMAAMSLAGMAATERGVNAAPRVGTFNLIGIDPRSRPSRGEVARIRAVGYKTETAAVISPDT